MNRFRECREASGLTQKYVALTLGVKGPSVSNWESGKTTPTTENVASLAKLYNVSVDYLLGRDEKQPKSMEDAERERYLSKLTEYTPAQLKELTDLAARLWPEEKKRRQS
nr:MAG TPA: helix-turn-helix domain protein [Caudoviricetes sp.]